MPKQMNETEVYSRNKGEDMCIAYDTSNRTQYVGLAKPGSATASAVWQIYKLSYDATSGGVAKRRYCDGDDKYDNIWDNYSSLDYTDL